VMKYRYGLVSDPASKVYVNIEDAVMQTGNYGHLPNAPAYVAIGDEAARDGKTYYHNPLGWMSAADVQLVTPSALRGIRLTRPVDFRFGWVLAEMQSVNAAGTPIRTYSRYEIVHEVPAVAEKPGYFAIGPDEWLPDEAVAVTGSRVPEDAGAGVCRFLYVDLSEQTLRAYDNCQLEFATLVSTGKDARWTFTGRFTILNKLENTRLTPPEGSISVYYLQGVPNFMSYAAEVGFHGAYWHDDFGTPVSHGCVNLSPADAQWLYEWAREGDNVIIARP
jgi:lipoprotein-anchoring transpeptidase ErfK/SrfK